MAKKPDPLTTDDPNQADAADVQPVASVPPAVQPQALDPDLEAEVQRQTAAAELAEQQRAAAEEASRRVRDAANIRKRAAAAAAAGIYRVTFNGQGADIEARDANEARAKFNEAHRTSVGPKNPGWSVKKVA